MLFGPLVLTLWLAFAWSSERYARGEISSVDYQECVDQLRRRR